MYLCEMIVCALFFGWNGIGCSMIYVGTFMKTEDVVVNNFGLKSVLNTFPWQLIRNFCAWECYSMCNAVIIIWIYENIGLDNVLIEFRGFTGVFPNIKKLFMLFI